SPHGGNRFHHPIDNAVGWVQHHHFRLILRPATLCGHVHFHGVTGNDLIMDHRRSVVLGVFPRTGRIGQNRGTQYVVRVVIGATHPFVDHVVQTHGGVPAHIHTHLHEHRHDPGILTDRTMPLGAHPGVDEDLRHGVLGRG